MAVGAAEIQKPCRSGFILFLFLLFCLDAFVDGSNGWRGKIGIVVFSQVLLFGGQAGDKWADWMDIVGAKLREWVDNPLCVRLLKQINKWFETLVRDWLETGLAQLAGMQKNVSCKTE